MTVVCLDTQIIQWGVLGQIPHPAQDHLVIHSKGFIRWLDKQKCDVILPSIIVGELLAPIAPAEHAATLAKIRKEWIIADYDLRAAHKFAQMRYDKNLKQMMEEIRKRNPYATRAQLKADAMIIATAVVHGAKILYSYDNDFISMAKDYVEAENFLQIAVQYNFLDGEDFAED